ncbi:hypothetical protein [uncultured Roseivirga sp.]|uniref:hypothetical protein n=1 Tax=uncultured Roseivirga sp. TaxID=543088 RepID=UPI000D78F9D2|nr:hypothetical protein [uncultured Roseivirga sp.]PWL28663.1 MAG: hypothetical protein DCO95_15035 [Roseivirga sp. XM-24bin3]
MNNEKNINQIKQSIAILKEEKKTYDLPITIINQSSVDFDRAEVAVKDEGSPGPGDETVDTVYFGYIAKGSSKTEYARLPGGIEFAVYKIQPRLGEEIYGFGYADNAAGVDITITD